MRGPGLIRTLPVGAGAVPGTLPKNLLCGVEGEVDEELEPRATEEDPREDSDVAGASRWADGGRRAGGYDDRRRLSRTASNASGQERLEGPAGAAALQAAPAHQEGAAAHPAAALPHVSALRDARNEPRRYLHPPQGPFIIPNSILNYLDRQTDDESRRLRSLAVSFPLLIYSFLVIN